MFIPLKKLKSPLALGKKQSLSLWGGVCDYWWFILIIFRNLRQVFINIFIYFLKYWTRICQAMVLNYNLKWLLKLCLKPFSYKWGLPLKQKIIIFIYIYYAENNKFFPYTCRKKTKMKFEVHLQLPSIWIFAILLKINWFN